MLGRHLTVGVALVGMITLAGCAVAAPGERELRKNGGRSGETDEAEDEMKTAGPNDANRTLGVDRAKMFDRLRGEIESVQVLSTAGLARLGLKWDDGSAFAAARARFLSARSDDDVYYALLALQRSTHDGHSRLDVKDVPKSAVALPLEDIAVEYETDGPRYVITKGERAGARITAVDGKPIAEVERELVTWVVGSSPEHWRASVAGWLTRRVGSELPAPKVGARTTFELTGANGKKESLELTWAAAAAEPATSSDGCTNIPNSDYAGKKPEHVGELLCVYAGANANTKIVRWFSFNYEDESGFRNDYERLFEVVGSATNILFDVRENQGGAFDPTVVSAFTTTPVKQLAVEVVYKAGLKKNPSLLDNAEGSSGHASAAKSHLLANANAEKSPQMPFIGDDVTLPIPQSPMRAQVAVLTGPTCFSACDNFVTMMKYAGVARIAGMPAAAGDSPVRVHLPLKLEGGKTAEVVLTVAVNRRPDGTVLEGTPDAPNVPLFPSAATRGRYLDAAVKAVGF